MSAHKPSQDAFVLERQARWQELDRILTVAKALHRLPPDQISAVGSLYRAICADLMRARGSGYSREVVEHLDALAARAHNALYRSEEYRLARVWDLVARDFPRTVRESWRFMAAATAMFVIPLLIALGATLASPDIATEILPREQLEMLAQGYAEGFDTGRSESADVGMAGFYVYNNIGISFRVFATGIFFGLGSAFFLVFNGVVIGATLGYVINAGAGQNILTFVMGHGAFELTAIVISGGAGLRMGYALVRTEGRTRVGSLRAQGPALARLALGAAVMLAIAALIEGFWSPSSLPYAVKWGAAGGFWLAVMIYFVVAGRSRGGADA
jgi:uncharacterized membrane protein SpoIIM required for sporulation